MKRILFALLLVLTACSCGTTSTQTEPEIITSSSEKPKLPELIWYEVSDELLENAKNSGKILMMFIYDPSCGWCKKMSEVTFKDECVVNKLHENYLLTAIDLTKVPELETEINAVPLTVFVFPNENTVSQKIVGFIDPVEFCSVLIELDSMVKLYTPVK